MEMWTGLIWLRIRAGGRLLSTLTVLQAAGYIHVKGYEVAMA
jgi:hypothetical protein